MMQTYFIQCGATGHVKIGRSDEPWKRFSKIQSDTPGELTMLAVVAKGADYEAAMHRMFAADNVRGEWFAMSPSLRAYIDGLPEAVKPKRPERRTYTIEGTSLGDVPLAALLGISKSYAAQIRGGYRSIPLGLALDLFAARGERIGPLLGATDDEIAVLKKFNDAPEYFSASCRAGTAAALRTPTPETV